MLPLAINDQNKQFKIIFTTVYIGKFMIDRYFCFETCGQGKCVKTQLGIKSEATCSQCFYLMQKLISQPFLFVCLFVMFVLFSIFNNLL